MPGLQEAPGLMPVTATAVRERFPTDLSLAAVTAAINAAERLVASYYDPVVSYHKYFYNTTEIPLGIRATSMSLPSGASLVHGGRTIRKTDTKVGWTGYMEVAYRVEPNTDQVVMDAAMAFLARDGYKESSVGSVSVVQYDPAEVVDMWAARELF